MHKFTFVVFTYNQENFILEHLESIKNQIIKYGTEYENTIIICDDCSSDRTLEFAEKWCIKNSNLGYRFKIIKQESNAGIVNNYLSALRNVETNMFSIVAGDDLYNDNSVYDAAEKSNFVYTPRISFNSEGNVHREKLWLFKKCLITKKPVKSVIQKMMKYKMVIDVMSVKWRKEFCTDSFYIEVSKYNWVEDYPSMNNILNNPSCKISLYPRPIILYRDDSGISQKRNFNKNSVYNIDQLKMFEDYELKIKKYPKYINIYNYIFGIIKLFDHIHFFFNSKIKAFEHSYDIECQEAQVFLKKICSNAADLKIELIERS